MISTAASLDQQNHDRNPWINTLLQHLLTKEIVIETFGSIPYCSIPRPRKCKVLNQGFLSWFFWSRDDAVWYWTKDFYHDFLGRGILQSGTEPRVSIMISLVEGCCSKVLNQKFLSRFPLETLGSVPYCSIHQSRKSRQKPLVQYLTAASLDQGNHNRNPWFNTLLQHLLTKEIVIET
jgi:hypothetical protein